LAGPLAYGIVVQVIGKALYQIQSKQSLQDLGQSFPMLVWICKDVELFCIKEQERDNAGWNEFVQPNLIIILGHIRWAIVLENKQCLLYLLSASPPDALDFDLERDARPYVLENQCDSSHLTCERLSVLGITM
jgi:hypothetical protein